MSFSQRDGQEMLQEMGICSKCHDHMPCGCESEFQECIILEKKNVCPHEEISGKLCSACKIPDDGKFCGICGMYNTIVENEYNNGACFNCNTQL